MPSEFERLLSRYDAPVRRLARSTRRLVRGVLPGAIEQVDPAGRVGYGVGARMTDIVCVILLSRQGVKLGMYDGALTSPETLESPALRTLLRRAVAAKQASAR